MLGAALFMGNCSGHGKGNGCKFQPGHAGGPVELCPHGALDVRIKALPVIGNEPVASWPMWPQLPKAVPLAASARVVINGKIPIVDQDELTPHPTPTMFLTESFGKECYTLQTTPAYHCTLGSVGGREGAAGHPRKLFASSMTVFVGGKRLGRFADRLGTGTGSGPYPCLSVVSGSSANVFVGA